jgi:hypothetical protein
MLKLRTLSCLFLLAACGEEDDRPQTAEYIVTTILAPTCGRVACHSEATASKGLVFDSLENARDSLNETIRPGRADRSLLFFVINGDAEPMPPEGPLPKADIELIRSWIDNGAEGLEP